MAWLNIKKQTPITFNITKGFKRKHNGHSMQKIIMKTECKKRGVFIKIHFLIKVESLPYLDVSPWYLSLSYDGVW